MINKDISDDIGFSKLSPPAAVLFCLLIPHFNSHGKQNGGCGRIKDEVCPLVSYLTQEKIPALLCEISTHTSVKWFECGGRFWLHSLKFLSKHQNLRADKLGEDKLPNYSGTTPVLVPDQSQTSPVLVPHEVEGEGEVEEKQKGKSEGGTEPPVDNSDDPPLPDPEPETPDRKQPVEKSEPQNPKPQFETPGPKNPEPPPSGNTRGERWNEKQGNELDGLMNDIRDRYGERYHGRVINFVRANFNRCNPSAMLKCLRRLIQERMKGTSIPVPERYLEAALNGNGKDNTGENGKAEAEESARECEAHKRDFTSLKDLIPEGMRTQ